MADYGVPEECRKALGMGILAANVEFLEPVRARVIGHDSDKTLPADMPRDARSNPANMPLTTALVTFTAVPRLSDMTPPNHGEMFTVFSPGPRLEVPTAIKTSAWDIPNIKIRPVMPNRKIKSRKFDTSIG